MRTKKRKNTKINKMYIPKKDTSKSTHRLKKTIITKTKIKLLKSSFQF